jgi:DNA-binding MarR family transcriptional regulator
MQMSDLSRFLLVSNGNVTGIVERLVGDGLVQRAAREGDRRAFVVRLTQAGVARFEAMAAAHEEWIAELLGEIGEAEAKALSAMLKAFRSNWEDGH